MGYRPKNRRQAAEQAKPVADMPHNLMVYDPADWLPPDVPQEPADGYDWAAWDAVDAAHRDAYAAFQWARADWYSKHALPPIADAIATPDEPFDPPPRKVDARDLAALEPRSSGRPSPLARLGRASVALPPVVRNTTRRDRFRAKIRRGEPPCHLCGDPIDYTADHLDPRSFTIDHVVALAAGGEDTLDNLAACHRGCNLSKGDGTARQLSTGPTACAPGPCEKCRGAHRRRPGVEFETFRR